VVKALTSATRRSCCVVSTHDLELALRLADHVWLLDRDRAGPIRFTAGGTGSPVIALVSARPRTRFVVRPGERIAGRASRKCCAAGWPVRGCAGRVLAAL
jgi:ABC-type cobalamin/Fe3+-siderophores transport system ATPase subunit